MNQGAKKSVVELASRCPYRKPTQVDGERIPRRSEQCSLRNSAKKQVYLRYIPCPDTQVYGAATKDPLPTVYQKLRSVLKR